ncbi:MAG: DUF2914 domain-containing protein [Desulfobacteraceae bacterium]|nr:MAG: DUF2914 domain-containing protein [Desulfobacteraceae bacterium]
MKTRVQILVVIMMSMLMMMAVPMTFAQDEQAAVPEEQADVPDEKTAVQDEQAASDNIRIEDAAICRSVENLEPVGAGDVFSSVQNKLSCFCRVIDAKEDTEITHNWYFGDTLMAGINLHVGSRNWRTYSTKTILPEQTGEWKVEILSQNGEMLKRIIFMVQE